MMEVRAIACDRSEVRELSKRRIEGLASFMKLHIQTIQKKLNIQTLDEDEEKKRIMEQGVNPGWI